MEYTPDEKDAIEAVFEAVLQNKDLMKEVLEYVLQASETEHACGYVLHGMELSEKLERAIGQAGFSLFCKAFGR